MVSSKISCGSKCADVAIFAFVLVTTIVFFSFVFGSLASVLFGGLGALTHGKDFENSPCSSLEGDERFQVKIPYKPKSYLLNKQSGKLLEFLKLPELSVCVAECPYQEKTTKMLIENGYGSLFDFEGGFVCGKLPKHIGPYKLVGGRCYPTGTSEVHFSTGEAVFYNENVSCFVCCR